ncbi:hypothetical protein IGL98_003229 [Enterococcus sp. DIV0840]|uniref:GIN domain-containing protein n=1 Tax=Enterococcus TaxID=1350 RepID=UPI001A906971|nr:MULTISPECIES: DUF2807 domain-containing protein [Enterococcus]MBO0436130.1 DUF2807 domain-containing protein [Enterococcus sp. DIV0849a]MBO0475298.1 DUF2807 domain-containing protein [Enterococcus ureasiticus]
MRETKIKFTSVVSLIVGMLFTMFTLGASSASAFFYSSDGWNTNDLNSTIIQGDKNITDRTYEVYPFSEIEVSGSLQVSVSSDYSNDIQVKTDDNIQDHIIVKVESGILKLKIKGSIAPTQPVQIKVPYYFGLLSKVNANSSSRVSFETDVEAENFYAICSSSSTITFNSIKVNNDVLLYAASYGSIIMNNLDALNTIKATCNSLGVLHVLNPGQADSAILKASSNGKIKMDVIDFNTVNAEGSSSSYISFTANKVITIKSISFAEIEYKGESKQNDITKYSFGKVRKIG